MTSSREKTKPRLLYVENFLPSFRSSRMGLALAAEAQGYEGHVAVPFGGTDGATLNRELEWHDLAIDRNLSPYNEAKTLGSLVALYRRLRPDLLHHIRAKAIVYGGVAARSLHIPAVVNALTGLGHVFHTDSMQARLLRTFVTDGLRLACRHANQRLIVQNSDDLEFCVWSRICPAERIVLIKGSGVDLEKYRPLPEPEGPVLVILLGRMLWDKGVREFVAAAEKLRASGVRARFALAGRLDPESPAALDEETLKQWERAGIVEWWGWQEDMKQAIAQAHIICLPSYGEGAPRVLMEASACGRAIVTTDVPGCRDVVIDGENGLLIPAKDVDTLAAAITRLITDPELRHKLGKRGPQMMAESFSRRAVIARSLEVYREVLGSAKYPPHPRRYRRGDTRKGEERQALSTAGGLHTTD
jgi:glycosyltransferase involved in cell wall biosynthesis